MKKHQILNWIKKPENIFFVLLLITVTIIGVIDKTLEFIIIAYFIIFIFGLVLGLIFKLINKL